MANRLKNLTITSVDLCKQGANPEAYVKFYKSREEEVENVEFRTEEMEGFVNNILKCLEDEDKEKSIKEVAKTFEDQLLENNAENKEEEMAKGFVLDDMEDEDKTTLKKLMSKYKVGGDENEEDMEEPKTDKKVKKSVDELGEEYEAVIAKTKEAQRNLEIITKATEFTKYKDLGLEPTEVAKTYLGMQDANEDFAKSYIKSLDDQLKMQEESGIFKSFGKSGDSTRGWEAIEKIAKNYITEGKASTEEEAIAKACQEHPEHVKEYEEELN